ncbi:hypothetical protein [Dyella sp. 2HG41-7]|uniref:hypothetical protein n=1 Tax=Dyella sp. 2HG41-7 TaxID=2883239 RepID=UPI001F2EACC2|nr:hypothetical protein [Dyella sp. 2HG41-7]
MSTFNTKGALIAGSFLFAAITAPNTFAQGLKTNTGAIAPTSPLGIFPPTPTPIPVPATPPLDSELYTQYSISGSYTTLNWSVCGSTQTTSGCYASGTMGPFGKIGAVIAGAESDDYASGIATQNIYVVDEAVNGGTGVMLFVYQKKDVVTSSSDSTTTTPINAVSLSLTGGVGAHTYMVGNDNCLVVATDQGPHTLIIRKSDLSIRLIGGDSPPEAMSSITTDRNGFVVMTSGYSPSTSGFLTLMPSCYGDGDGGGGEFMINATNGVSTGGVGNIVSSAIPSSLATRVQIHPKLQATPQAIH